MRVTQAEIFALKSCNFELKKRRKNTPHCTAYIFVTVSPNLKVTKQFCDWVEKLGGGDNNIEESTMMSLFASGYETKVGYAWVK